MDRSELTPVDIRNRDFATGITGYKKDDVRAFLEQVAAIVEDKQSCLDKALREVTLLQTKLASQPELPRLPEVKTPSANEELISRTLMLAEKTRDEILKDAHQEAEALIANARKTGDKLIRETETQARKVIEDTRHYLEHLEDKYRMLKEQERGFVTRFRTDLTDLLGKLDRDTVIKPENEQYRDHQFNQLTKTAAILKEEKKPQPVPEQVVHPVQPIESPVEPVVPVAPVLPLEAESAVQPQTSAIPGALGNDQPIA